MFWSLLLNKVGDLGYASKLGNYAEYSGAPNEDKVLQYASVSIKFCSMPVCTWETK